MRRFQIAGALIAALLLAGCEGDSPTAPSGGGSGGGGGGGTSTATTVVVTTSNPTPLIDSTSVITATVTQNGAPAPNGTAVEFTTDFGTFEESGTTSVLRTTTGGIATATLTSPSAGTARVRVRVLNVLRETTVEFRESTSTSVSITNITPASGRASGGEQIVITGRNFAAPVRVLFDGREATIVSVTDTQIRVVTPPADVPASAQFREVDVTVITRAGTPQEERVTRENGFRYELEVLSPLVYHISPASGPNEGNTRITIFGEGFQAPTRVFFGTGGGPGPLVNQVELEVVQVTFNQIIAITPPALGLGVELRDQQVTVRVLNVLTNRDTALPLAFRYGPRMAITAIAPNQGPFSGGTRVTIYGWGFDDPVSVSIAGLVAQVVRVSGTEIVAVTNALAIDGCDDVTGDVVVTNIEDGGTATGPDFIYVVDPPFIEGLIDDTLREGDTAQIVATNVSGDILTVRIGSVTTTATRVGTTDVFQFVVPTMPAAAFDTEPCGFNNTGTRAVPTTFDVTVTDPVSGCPGNGDTAADDSLRVTPALALCEGEEEPPPPTVTVSDDVHDFGCEITSTTAETYNVNVTNSAGSSSSVTITASIQDRVGTCATGFSVAPTSTTTIEPGGTRTFAVTFAPTADGTCSANLAFTSPQIQLPEVLLTGTAGPTCP